MYKCQILADSISELQRRLTTFEITYPRFVHSELMTHRVFSRNTASSRAIPTRKLIAQILRDPAGPVWWGKNQSGMQSKRQLGGWRLRVVQGLWYGARYPAIGLAYALSAIGLHKQIANRVLEPWMWITALVSSTEWENFFSLRCHPDAQPEIQHIAYMMREAYQASKPRLVRENDPLPWHLPLTHFVDLAEWAEGRLSTEDLIKASVGRCARVSYLTHHGTRDVGEDIRLHGDLVAGKHWSPLEHIATPCGGHWGNFDGWKQWRKHFEGEDGRVNA